MTDRQAASFDACVAEEEDIRLRARVLVSATDRAKFDDLLEAYRRAFWNAGRRYERQQLRSTSVDDAS